MKMEELHRVHMLGIGGIGMSGLARYFMHRGVEVSGYDRTRSDLCEALIEEGAQIHFEDDPKLIPETFLNEDPSKALVIRSLAIGEEDPEFRFLREQRFKVLTRPQALASVAKDYECIAIAGTHGKTTTSCMLAFLLKECGIPCHALLGGISTDLGSNVLLEGEAEYLITEADEYGRSFLELEPSIAVITAVEPDHMDVYGDRSGLEEAFASFQKRIRPQGKLLIEEQVKAEASNDLELIRYGSGENADVKVQNVRPEEGFYAFDLDFGGGKWEDLRSRMPGHHNVMNLSAAIVLAKELGAEEEGVKKALEHFQGVRRRFEFRYDRKGRVLIDDYAHHPTELRASILTAREMYPDKRIVGIFQPHLYSRTRDHAKEFGKVLSELDELLLLPIYPAREAPIPGVSSQMLLEEVHGIEKRVLEREELEEAVRGSDPGVLLLLGAGDISEEAEKMERTMDELSRKEA